MILLFILVINVLIILTVVSSWMTPRYGWMSIRHRTEPLWDALSGLGQPQQSTIEQDEQTQMWKYRLQQLKKDAQIQRHAQRHQRNREMLEDRAKYLALRALRLQTRFQQQMQLNHNNSIHTTIQPDLQWPVPSLSSGATRHYKRKEDTIITEAQRKLEQRLYGKRFTHAWKVYTRLLEALDQVRNHGKQQATQLVRIEQRKHMGPWQNSSHTITATTTSRSEELLAVHKRNHERMKLLIRLTLHGYDHYFFFPKKEKEDFIVKMDPTSLIHVDTEDILRAIQIRGNVKRIRSRLPKKREKILEYFVESYSKPLF